MQASSTRLRALPRSAARVAHERGNHPDERRGGDFHFTRLLEVAGPVSGHVRQHLKEFEPAITA